MKAIVLNLLHFTWCLPQTLLGMVFYLFLKLSKSVSNTSSLHSVILIRVDKLFFIGGVSLGKFIFISGNQFSENTILHEYGHAVQSLMLGPLYLIVVGLPSVTLSILATFSTKIKNNYFKFFPENWADKLGKVCNK